MAFRERLWPTPGVWIGMGLFGAAFGIIPAPVNHTAGWVTAGVGLVVLLTLAAINPPTINVGDGTLQAGRARLPLRVVSGVDVLDVEAMRLARGRQLDARAFLCLRGWVHTGVRVHLADPEDPAPYWLLSSRRPEELARAVRAGMPGTVTGPAPGPGRPGSGTGSEQAANDHAGES